MSTDESRIGKGKDLQKQADAQASKSSCCGSTGHVEGAAKLYFDAGNAFKTAQQWDAAGGAQSLSDTFTLYARQPSAT